MRGILLISPVLAAVKQQSKSRKKNSKAAVNSWHFADFACTITLLRRCQGAINAINALLRLYY
jgi:hypothetical protein